MIYIRLRLIYIYNVTWLDDDHCHDTSPLSYVHSAIMLYAHVRIHICTVHACTYTFYMHIVHVRIHITNIKSLRLGKMLVASIVFNQKVVPQLPLPSSSKTVFLFRGGDRPRAGWEWQLEHHF